MRTRFFKLQNTMFYFVRTNMDYNSMDSNTMATPDEYFFCLWCGETKVFYIHGKHLEKLFGQYGAWGRESN